MKRLWYESNCWHLCGFNLKIQLLIQVTNPLSICHALCDKSYTGHVFFFHPGSVPVVDPPSETVELNRTSSVNLTCLVSGQPGADMEWYRNGLVIPSPPPAAVLRNGSVKSVLMLSRVKYKDRGSVLSCTAWYPGLPINATRNIHLLVHGMCFRFCVFPPVKCSLFL